MTGPPHPEWLVAGRYRLEERLARGGMAEVWEATDMALDRVVAVKLLQPALAEDPDVRRRFRAEAVAVARLVHPSIVAVYDTCADGDAEAMVMELIEGRTLRAFLDERIRLDPVEVVHIGGEVASALDCAHRAGVVHRDVKPANILLADDGRVVVTDFGIAKVLDQPDLTRTASMLGTVKYLAPEQVEGGLVDGRADVYGLGAVLYEALTGQPPFAGATATATALARLTHTPPLASHRTPGTSASLDEVLATCLARHPVDRYPSAHALRSALVAVTAHEPAESPAPDGRDADLTVAEALDDRTRHLELDPGAGDHPIVTAGPPAAPDAWRADPPARHRRRPALAVTAALLIVAAVVVVVLLVLDAGPRGNASSAPVPVVREAGEAVGA